METFCVNTVTPFSQSVLFLLQAMQQSRLSSPLAQPPEPPQMLSLSQGTLAPNPLAHGTTAKQKGQGNFSTIFGKL